MLFQLNHIFHKDKEIIYTSPQDFYPFGCTKLEI